MSLPVMNGGIFERGASLYTVSCDEELVTKMEKVRGPYLPNIANLDGYRRFDSDISPYFPIQNSSFSIGLYLYYKAILQAGQHRLGRTFFGLLHKINKLYLLKIRHHPGDFNPLKNCYDDFVRRHLKAISAWSFPRVFSAGPAYMFLMHCDMLGAHAPWSEEQIVRDIDEWVSGDKHCDFDLLKPYMDQVFALWPTDGSKDTSLDFADFCADPLRWGTSGGAKTVEMFGQKIRSKWAWAWSRLINKQGEYKTVDLYAEALKEGNNCVVALKEEEKKTREIITTPMSSYLRQSYLAYRWGNLPGDTPLSQPRWLGDFQTKRYAWYGCADADRFDHSVSKQLVTYVLDKLGSLDSECRQVADEEIASLDDLVLSWRDKKWKYKGGLLSGWRLTSMIGTLTSLAIGRFIISDLQLYGAHAIAMGDDIMIASPLKTATKEQLYKSYAKTGFRVNLAKTTVGSVGEFLRQTYSDRGVLGYPANGLSAVLFSPPWLERYALEKEQEISKSWLTFYSRLLPHCVDETNLRGFFFKLIRHAVRSRTRISGPLDDWITTPISAGGGGPIEWSDPKRWAVLDLDFQNVAPDVGFLQLFGISSKELSVATHSSKHIRHIDLSKVKHDSSSLSRVSPGVILSIPKWINKTRGILTWLLNEKTTPLGNLEKYLGTKLPRGFFGLRRLDVVKKMMGIEKSPTGFCSVQTTVAATGHYQHFMASLTRVAASNRRLFSAKDLPAIATMYATQVFGGKHFVSGTW